jgi:hypothetical protein
MINTIIILVMLITRTATTTIFKRSLELRFYLPSALSFLLVLLIELYYIVKILNPNYLTTTRIN